MVASAAFKRPLAIDRNNVSAHNAMGDALIFERKFDAASEFRPDILSVRRAKQKAVYY